jgi:hypothetical protein
LRLPIEAQGLQRGLLRAGVALAAVCAFAFAAGTAGAQRPGAKLPNGKPAPNFEGIWERPEGQGIRIDPAGTTPPYKPDWEAKYQTALAARARGEVVADPTSRCLPPGMPRVMVATYPLEILQTPGQVTIIAEWSSQVRRIFTDGRKHPDADHLDPTFNGHSIGHWDGQTLVVDTVGIHGHTSFDASPLTHSDQMTVQERIRLVNKNLLEDVITITDPGAFTKPWVVTRRYARGGPNLQIMEYICEENNREIHQTTAGK